MPINPHQLKPSELVKLMNSTPLGETLSRDRAYRQRDRGGFKIGDGATIDLVRYTGWLFAQWLERRANPQAGMSRDEKHRITEAARDRVKRHTMRNIGQIPVISDIERRESCRNDLAKFIMTYAGEGKAPFSEDHLRVIRRIEVSVLQGGRFVEAVYLAICFCSTCDMNSAIDMRLLRCSFVQLGWISLGTTSWT
jgi:hypothetical protein